MLRYSVPICTYVFLCLTDELNCGHVDTHVRCKGVNGTALYSALSLPVMEQRAVQIGPVNACCFTPSFAYYVMCGCMPGLG